MSAPTPVEHYQLCVCGDTDGAALAQLMESLTAQDADWRLTYYVDGRPVHEEHHSPEWMKKSLEEFKKKLPWTSPLLRRKA